MKDDLDHILPTARYGETRLWQSPNDDFTDARLVKPNEAPSGELNPTLHQHTHGKVAIRHEHEHELSWHEHPEWLLIFQVKNGTAELFKLS